MKIIFLFAIILLFGCIKVAPSNLDNGATEDNNNLVDLPPLLDENLQEEIETTEPIDTNANEESLIEEEPPVEEEPETEEEEEPLIEEEPPVEEEEEEPLLPEPRNRSFVELLVNTNTLTLHEGDFVEIGGAGDFFGTQYKVFFQSILSTGAEYSARFRLETEPGEEVNTKTFVAGEELVFENGDGDIITFDGLLLVEGVFFG